MLQDIENVRAAIREVSSEITDVQTEIGREKAKIEAYNHLSSELLEAAGYIAQGLGNLINASIYLDTGYEGTGYGADYQENLTTAKQEVSDYHDQLLEYYNAAIAQRDIYQESLEANNEKLSSLQTDLGNLQTSLNRLLG